MASCISYYLCDPLTDPWSISGYAIISVSMYYIRMFVCIYICMYVMYVSIYVCISVCMCVYMYVYMYV